jgi:tRNA A37 methylthiotransferase MiaB
MNAHDSERLAGLLDEAGYQPAGDGETPDVVVFNTCAVRENAADRLYGNLGHLLPQKKKGMQIAVGGCLAQMERTRITQRAPWVDVVYGTHNMASLPALLERARVRHEALHRAEPARQGEGPPSRRHPGRDPRAGGRGSARGHLARPERELLRGGIRRSQCVRQAAARLR